MLMAVLALTTRSFNISLPTQDLLAQKRITHMKFIGIRNRGKTNIGKIPFKLEAALS